MIKIERSDAPKWLLENWEQWGKDYEESGKFEWRFGQQKKLELVDLLLDMTNDHCSYCDNFPMARSLQETIDHFRPKSIFKLIAYLWENLFVACSKCQQRGNNFNEKLLKPDEPDYSFHRYFEFDDETFMIEPQREATTTDKERATITITLFRLNGKEEDRGTRRDISLERRRIYQQFINDPNPEIEDYPFRFMFG